MTSRTRPRRALKVPAGATTVRIPRQRGRRNAQPFVVVMPERRSLTREAVSALGGVLWHFRRQLAPTGFAVLAFALSGLLHILAGWSGFLIGTAAVLAAGWLAIVQRNRPETGTVLAWRIGLASLAFLAASWVATATVLGPLTGPLETVWLLICIAAQAVWLIVRRTH
ncbi:hypothetical protein ACFU96_19775 [Streptomyces sp. NPDC057620]|uniref:hypothetical protein n=1 Tax=Streptomyces sp. NPDC057620 TaxID=3346185 RepID=UPI0036A98D00